jgi:hypothetical protein
VSNVKVHTFENPELEGNIITTNGKWRCPRDDLTLNELAQKLTFDGVKQNSGKLWRLNRSISRKGAITLGKIITLQRELKGCESVTLQAAYSFRQLAAMYTDCPCTAEEMLEINKARFGTRNTELRISTTLTRGTIVYLSASVRDRAEEAAAAEEEEKTDEEFISEEGVGYYKVFETVSSAGCHMSIMTEDSKWHNLALNDECTEGMEQVCGDQWQIDPAWYLAAVRNIGKRTPEPNGSKKDADVVGGQEAGWFVFEPPASTVSLHRGILTGDSELCVINAFVNAVMRLHDHHDSKELPIVVLEQLTDEHEFHYRGYAESAANQKNVPGSWKKITLSEFQVFLESKFGKQLLRWADASESYNQIVYGSLLYGHVR